MPDIMAWLTNNPFAPGIVIGALVATLGWLYTNRRARMLTRRQHTFNALLAASFNKGFQDAQNTVRPYTRVGKFPDLGADDNADLRDCVVFLLNHYEFLAAGIRVGDISEQLLKNSERGTIIRLFETAEPFIVAVRDSRKRVATFEHLEWLYERWHEVRPSWWHRIFEHCRGRPLYHPVSRWWILAGVATLIIAVLSAWFHPSIA